MLSREVNGRLSHGCAASCSATFLLERELVVDDVDVHDVASCVASSQQRLGEGILKVLQDDAFQGSCTKRGLVTEIDQTILGRIADLDLHAAVAQQFAEPAKLNLDDAAQKIVNAVKGK